MVAAEANLSRNPDKKNWVNLTGVLEKVLEFLAHELEPEKWISAEIGMWSRRECQHSWGGDDYNITHVCYK